MELAIQNKYEIADGTVENVSSLMSCTDAQRYSLDELSFGEMTSDNCPVLLANSYATVNGCLTERAAADGAPMFIASASGSTYQPVSAAPANTPLYLCLIPSGLTTVTFALKAAITVAFDVEKRGFYEAGTQNRVFGECLKLPNGTFPAKYKRRYSTNETYEKFLRMYSEGVDIVARRYAPALTLGRVGGAIISSSIKANKTTGITSLRKINVTNPLIVEFVITCKTWFDYYSYTVQSQACAFVATLLDVDGATEVGDMPLRYITAPNNDSAVGSVTVLMELPVGKYDLKLKTVTEYLSGHSFGLYVDTVTAYIRNVNGNIIGSWGNTF